MTANTNDVTPLPYLDVTVRSSASMWSSKLELRLNTDGTVLEHVSDEVYLDGSVDDAVAALQRAAEGLILPRVDTYHANAYDSCEYGVRVEGLRALSEERARLWQMSSAEVIRLAATTKLEELAERRRLDLARSQNQLDELLRANPSLHVTGALAPTVSPHVRAQELSLELFCQARGLLDLNVPVEQDAL